MSRATSAELLPMLRERSGRRGRQARSGMLDEFCEQFGYSRKHAIKVLRAKLPQPGGRPCPGPVHVYDADVLRVTKALWLASDQLCGKRLAPARANPAGLKTSVSFGSCYRDKEVDWEVICLKFLTQGANISFKPGARVDDIINNQNPLRFIYRVGVSGAHFCTPQIVMHEVFHTKPLGCDCAHPSTRRVVG